MTTEQKAIALTGTTAMSILSGVSHRTVQRIAVGKIVPHKDTADKIAEGRRKWLRQRIERKVDG